MKQKKTIKLKTKNPPTGVQMGSNMEPYDPRYPVNNKPGCNAVLLAIMNFLNLL